MKDYAASIRKQPDKYFITNHLSYVNTTTVYHSYLAKFSNLVKPKSFKETAKDNSWIQAMKQKIQALEANYTQDVIDLPPGKNVVGPKWVYMIKYKSNGEGERFKARLVAKGYSKQERFYYHKTFFSIAKMVTVKVSLLWLFLKASSYTK